VGDEVFGFIVYKVDSSHKVLHIQYIAVAEKHRRHGIGSKLIKSLQQYASKTLTRSTVEKIACACVPEAVEFYQKHCFRKGKRIVPDDENGGESKEINGVVEVQIPLQFQMEWKVPQKRGSMKS
jgi:ribosomal protein S18 acetylase RimI-like enzyme